MIWAVGLAGQCYKRDRLAWPADCPCRGNVLARVRVHDLVRAPIRSTFGPIARKMFFFMSRRSTPLLPSTKLAHRAPLRGLARWPLGGDAKDNASRCGFQERISSTLHLSGAQESRQCHLADGYGVPIVRSAGELPGSMNESLADRDGGQAFARPSPQAPTSRRGGQCPHDARWNVCIDTTSPLRTIDAPRSAWSPPHARHFAARAHETSNSAVPTRRDRRASLSISRTSEAAAAFASGDVGTVALARAACDSPALACAKDGGSPVRATQRNLAAGSYRAVVETRVGNPVQLTALVRPAVPPSLVPFADTCATALLIDEKGGFFQGITANALPDYSAGCDTAGTGPAGAPDQMLKLVLSAQRRVIFDMQGWLATLLDFARGILPVAELREVLGGCVALAQLYRHTLTPVRTGALTLAVSSHGFSMWRGSKP